MLALLLLLQSSTVAGAVVTGSAPASQGAGPIQVVLLPFEYTNIFNARAQKLIDDYWAIYMPDFVRDKELFLQVPHVAQRQALSEVIERMRFDTTTRNFVLSTTNGRFEFRNVPPGDYKLVAATGGRTPQVWTETFQVKDSAPISISLKNRFP